MDFVDWQRVKDVYGNALDLPPEARTIYVESVAGAEGIVRSEVLRLLMEEPQMGDFMRPLTVVDQLTSELGREKTTSFGDGQIVAERYRILRRIRSGGMGEVFEAFDVKLQQRIALKTVLPEIAQMAQVMARFRREVALARTVTHPNVCRIFDLGEHVESGRTVAFLTMEYLAGETLAERLKREGPLAAELALSYGLQILEALDAAHRAGVVHRDLKPGNVMLVPSAETERAVVTDFGIARQVESAKGETLLTAPEAIIGTADYMAPEQWTGGAIDPTTDLYAFAVLFYEMLAGQKPTWPRSPAIVLDPRWERAIEACLDRNPRARPQTARAVVAMLQEPASPIRPRGRRAVVHSLLLLSILMALFWGFYRFTEWRGGSTSKIATKHVVMLPFRVGQPEIQTFADGLMESITQRLSQYEGTNQELVVASARENHQSVSSVREAKTKFGADYAVEGSMHAQENRMRLVLTVIDTANMRQIESTVIEGSRDKVFTLQDEAVSKLAGALNLRVQPKYAAELNRVSPMDPGAYDFFLQAKGYLQRNDRLVDINSAITLLGRALETAPDDAPAHAALAEAYWFKHERTSDAQWVTKAMEEGRRALQLDLGLAETHVILGRILAGTGKSQQAAEEFQKALGLDPRMPEAYLGLGHVYLEAKDYPRAEATYRKAIELRSRDWRGYKELGLFYYRRSDYRKAIEQFDRVVALSPDNASAYNNLGGFYGLLGEKVKAREMLEKAIDLEPDRISTLTNLSKLLFDEGRHDEAIRRWNAAVERNPSSFRLWGNLATAYERTHRIDEAHRAFTEAVRLISEAILVNPSNGELYSYRAHFLAPLGREADVLADLASADSLRSADVEMMVRDAVSLVIIGSLPRARAYLAGALARGYSAKEAARNVHLRRLSEP